MRKFAVLFYMSLALSMPIQRSDSPSNGGATTEGFPQKPKK